MYLLILAGLICVEKLRKKDLFKEFDYNDNSITLPGDGRMFMWMYLLILARLICVEIAKKRSLQSI